MSRLTALVAVCGWAAVAAQRVAVEVFVTPNCAATPLWTSDYTAGTCGSVQFRADSGVVFRCDESGTGGTARICDAACTVCADPVAFTNDQARPAAAWGGGVCRDTALKKPAMPVGTTGKE
jgi:hypothetical protein